MADNRAEFEINIYSPTTWNNLSDHEDSQSDEKLERQPVSIFMTRILKTVCKQYTETWQRSLKHPGLAPTGKERKTSIQVSQVFAIKPFIFIACSKVTEIFNLLDFYAVVFSIIRLMNGATGASIHVAIIFMWQSRGRQE